jgi:hypothetical protein
VATGYGGYGSYGFLGEASGAAGGVQTAGVVVMAVPAPGTDGAPPTSYDV